MKRLQTLQKLNTHFILAYVSGKNALKYIYKQIASLKNLISLLKSTGMY